MKLSKEFKDGAFPMAAVTVMTAIAPVLGNKITQGQNADEFKLMMKDFLVDLGDYLINKATNDTEFSYLMSRVGKVFDAEDKAKTNQQHKKPRPKPRP
jgi:hypothetical protein